VKVLVFDTETTDFNGYIIEVACVLIDIRNKKVLDFCATAVNPLSKVSPFVVKKFFINEEALQNYSTFDKVWFDKISHLFKNADLLVAHNIEFDLKVFSREASRWRFTIPRKETFCTCQTAKEFFNLAKKPKLEELAELVEVDTSKVERFYERLIEKSSYNPSRIRKMPLKYHNALYDTSTLVFAYAKLFSSMRKRRGILPWGV